MQGQAGKRIVLIGSFSNRAGKPGGRQRQIHGFIHLRNPWNLCETHFYSRDSRTPCFPGKCDGRGSRNPDSPRPILAQPLPAREVISRTIIIHNYYKYQSSQPLPAREVISREPRF